MTAVIIALNSEQEFFTIRDHHLVGLQTSFPTVRFHAVSDHELPAALAEADVYLGWQFDPDWLRNHLGLRWFATPSAGTDHLPVPQLLSSGITVTRSYGFHAQPVAEHAMGMLLAFSRGIITSSRLQRNRSSWKEAMAEEFFDLAGSRMLIVGCGSIGAHLGLLGHAFGMDVTGVRRTLPQGQHTFIDYVPATQWRDHLPNADVVVNLLPKSPTTDGMFDAAAFAALKPDSVFLNLGRGSTVDHQAMTQALHEKPRLRVALDVTTPRPLPRKHPLRRHPRVLLTPKSAAFSRAYMDGALRFFAANLHNYLSGRPMRGMAETALHQIEGSY
ncbi:D-2-hydroxyacid dehydrogenase [Streptomyces sp. PCS3-D2]|uniref:D-2-hydroxyacid dehydrogenase n=1 Tax=Streptomyces sp. PCS3-D2 TaxID=1460244 RepID=UPI0004460F3D|nr:D-2-hydroxyacid dehydrogenase [Streptomyces sp. PCS3-D2]WKV74183.1 D-2-hydroxyacid dehydrogenase [Streptomyces sp. PCS3-D2]